ncbi:hypothetical protein GLAREA_06671 [Glarea lozoyensis ATCC 20868]|uniref:2EXR domain-containing protein n=1 Tax=Glarea lozoyensis (strain ATCC 20868 / MF5171) TaxID=1116229 RepID=S3E5I9_GLAL2|nr:uncharacterized protein GLAREA_06671 [Glarea lozoyensis ATCC 20868]EPE33658.1 hypothetical protein GLAREA_06671 [Glarea lozoyensis ATCC 20868]
MSSNLKSISWCSRFTSAFSVYNHSTSSSSFPSSWAQPPIQEVRKRSGIPALRIDFITRLNRTRMTEDWKRSSTLSFQHSSPEIEVQMAETRELKTHNSLDVSAFDTSALVLKPTKNVNKETQTTISINPFSLSKLVAAGPISSQPTSVTRKHEILFNFPKLPPELRLRVYQHTFEPQIIAVDVFHVNISEGPARQTVARRTSPVPITLQINRESRTEGLRYYERIHIANDFKFFPIIYIHPQNDLLRLRAVPEKTLAEPCISIGMTCLLFYLSQRYEQKFTLILDGVVPWDLWFTEDRAPWDQGHIVNEYPCARKVFLNYTLLQADDGTLPMNKQDAENLEKVVAYTETMKSTWSTVFNKLRVYGGLELVPTLLKEMFTRSSFSGAVLNGYIGLLLELETTQNDATTESK